MKMLDPYFFKRRSAQGYLNVKLKVMSIVA
jgi:hypothetical protein